MKNKKIEVGDVCNVINVGRLYSTFDTFAISSGYPEIITNPHVSSEKISGKEVRVLYLEQNPSVYNKEIIAVVETTESPYLKFMIGTRGLKLNINKLADLVLEKYLLVKTLKMTVSDECVTKLLIETIIDNNPLDIEFINSNLISDDDYRNVLRKDGGLLGIIPEDRRNLELCKIAVTEELYAIKFVLENLRSLVNC